VHVKCIFDNWSAKPSVLDAAKHGLLIDTFAFIPVYSTFFASWCFWCALRLEEPWRRAADVLGYTAWLAGLLDYLENGGIALELWSGRFQVAPFTATAAYVKWTLILAVILFASLVTLRRSLIFCENRVHGHEHRSR